MTEDQIARSIVNTSFTIHNKLGPGLLESVYEEILFYELSGEFQVERQKKIAVIWDDVVLEHSLRADLIVDDLVLIEIKSVKKLESVHYKQALTYLRLTDLKLGLLINFNEALIKNGIKRIVNNL